MNEKIKRASKILIIWIAFHIIALVLSGTDIRMFNSYGSSQEENFWPLVAFVGKSIQPIIDKGGNITGIRDAGMEFRGIFYQYDTSEFIIYLVLGITFFGLYTLNNFGKKKET